MVGLADVLQGLPEHAGDSTLLRMLILRESGGGGVAPPKHRMRDLELSTVQLLFSPFRMSAGDRDHVVSATLVPHLFALLWSTLRFGYQVGTSSPEWSINSR